VFLHITVERSILTRITICFFRKKDLLTAPKSPQYSAVVKIEDYGLKYTLFIDCSGIFFLFAIIADVVK